jgi:hypothetical protein
MKHFMITVAIDGCATNKTENINFVELYPMARILLRKFSVILVCIHVYSCLRLVITASSVLGTQITIYVIKMY